MEKIYFCIDLKTFYASVECVERQLDPFQTDLIVADPSRSRGAICLAISPKMKERGIQNRCRVFEIPKNVHPIVAKPRMKKYIEYSARIYAIYLKYIAKEDIHPYSIDEMFLDVTSYLTLYQKTPFELSQTILQDIYETTGITASCGIGTNLYLAKVALDILAKNSSSHIAFLDEETYRQKLWHHLPITDFWQVQTGIEKRLHKLHLKDMYDIAHARGETLYQEFGVSATYLIDHAWGREPCTIQEIKNYRPKSSSLSNSQILFQDTSTAIGRNILTEMVDHLTLELVQKGLVTEHVTFSIGYSKDFLTPLKVSIHLREETDSYPKILARVLEEYDYQVSEQVPIRRIGITFSPVVVKKYEQLTLFSDGENAEKDTRLEKAMQDIQRKYGKNSILRAISYQDGSMQRIRNQLIGGHNAE